MKVKQEETRLIFINCKNWEYYHMNLVHDFSVMYLPERNLPINEQMITNHELKSRISFTQYMPKKLSFKYTLGNLSNRAVFNFLHNYVEKNLYVYFDNFYIVYKLVNDLKNKTIFSCGTA